MIVQAIKWIGDVDGYLELVDQRRLPVAFVKLQCRDTKILFDAIKTLAVRGAPAIGVAAAYGIVLALQESGANDSLEKALESLARQREYLASSRPTAVNLFWALDRMRRRAEEFVAGGAATTVQALRDAVLAEANAICAEDVDMCRRRRSDSHPLQRRGAGHRRTGNRAIADVRGAPERTQVQRLCGRDQTSAPGRPIDSLGTKTGGNQSGGNL